MPRGAKPKDPGQKVTRNAMTHPWQEAPASGWQHGEVPEPPPQLTAESLEVWATWFGAWWASFWKLEDVPQLRLVITLFDKTCRGELDPSKLTPYLDRFGLTPKGRQDLRWVEPKADEPADKRTGRARLAVVDAS